MRVIATTVVRESIRGKQKTGYIYDVDWEAGRVAKKLPVPEPSFPASDDNPRGGIRGGRGVAVTKGGIIVANYDTLYRYDDDWNVLSSLSHPLFVGIHEIDWDGEHLWAAATAIDAVLRVSLEGEVEVAWDPHEPAVASLLGLDRRPSVLDGSVDHRTKQAACINQLHVNGVTRIGDTTVVNCGLVRRRPPLLGRVLRQMPSLARVRSRPAVKSLVIRLNGRAEPEILISLNGHDFPTHNGQLLDDHRVVVNDSTHNTLRVFRLDDGVEEQAIRVPGSWLRGLEPLAPNKLLVGTAPATVACVDLNTGEIDERIQLSEDPNEAVHGLTVSPRSRNGCDFAA
jgi:hypothetical protein